jgi:hypothetical protein
MRICWLEDTGAAWTATVRPLTAACVLAAAGCAHHRADQYAYAPPYAPPVYSQPHVEMPAQPAAYAGAPGSIPAGAVPVGAMPTGSLPAGMVVAGPTMPAGTVVQAVGGECPPCATPGMEGMVMPATMVEGGGQTPPCPPGP